LATVQRYVHTDSTAGGDGTTNGIVGATRAYASLSEWESNAGGVATDDYIVDCAGGTTHDSTIVTVDFATAITSGSITIRGNRSDGEGFYDGVDTVSFDHYRFRPVLGAGFTALVLAENNITLDGVQINPSRATFSSAAFAVQVTNNGGTSSTITVRNCRILGDGDIGNGLGQASSSTCNRTYENNLVVNFPNKGIDARIGTNFNPTVNIYHNTIYGDTTAGGIGINAALASSGTGSSAVINIRGNACANNDADEITTSGSVGTINSFDNATDDTSGQIQNIVAADVWTDPGLSFVDVFSVKDTGSDLYQIVNPTVVSEDIREELRDGTNHDAGAFEFLSTGDESDNLDGSASTVSAGTAAPVHSVAL
jgi:hypothetical protein